MNMKSFCIILLLILFPFALSSSDYSDKIDWLYKRLQSKLWTKDRSFKSLSSPQHIKGLYKSYIHMNFVDKRNTYLSSMLRKISLDDNNMFVTNYVLYNLIETAELQTIRLNDYYLNMSLMTLQSFRDKNTPQGVPQYNFWPQNLVNGTWAAQSTNFLNVASMIPRKLPKPLKLIMKQLGFNKVTDMKKSLQTSTIPADNDDSSVNLALLGLLKETQSRHYDFWKRINYNIEDYYHRVLKYAYRPFTDNFSQNHFANQIDPRTYYLLSDYLAMKKAEALAQNETPNLILPTTWLINYQEQVQGKIMMPFSNNNVDATVGANLLFGISYLALTNQLNLNNIPQLKQLITDTTDLLVYVIEQKVSVRPDLALVYYPSQNDFFSFVSRIVNLYKRQQNLPFPLNYTYQKLSHVMKNKGTNILLNNSHLEKEGSIYWAQFLGNYANKDRNEDAIFSTSLALNALLDTWTVRKGKSIKYDTDIPDSVRKALKQGINYLNDHLNKGMKEYNAFFSGSWKSDETNPYIYPANVHLDKNNKNIDPHTATFKDVKSGMNYLMKGFVDIDQYEKMISQKWFDHEVPTKFQGYNQAPFPYWSAESITEVIAISVLSKFMKSEEAFYSQTMKELKQQKQD